MINKIKYRIGTIGNSYLQKVTWGYSECSIIDIPISVLYSNLIDREDLRIRYGKPCVCPELKEKLKYKINYLVGKTKIDETLFKDNSGKDFWQYTHPHCIRTTHYQKWCNQFLCDLDVTISIFNKKECDLNLLTFISKKEACNLTLENIKTTLDKICKLDVSTTIRENGCDVGAKVFVAQNYCKLENNFILDENTCNIAYKDYITQHGCNIDLKSWKKATNFNY